MTEIEKVIYEIHIPLEDMNEGLPKELNQFLKKLGYHFEMIDSKGFE